MEKQIIKTTEDFVKNQLRSDATGHDWYHVDRVRKNALLICKEEQAGDPFIIEMAALLHDIPDEKLNESLEAGERKLEDFLHTISLGENEKNHIKNIIATISYKGGRGSELISIEAKIVQDADRLDAIGAIGIARAFAYGGKKGQPIYEPSLTIRENMSLAEYRNGKSSSINHFYEKLLKLRDLLNTDAARNLAEKRHRVMENFLEQFYQEWNGQA
ncbi:HD domain-containing protein [Neobacillus muris]|uniref:HD domain-containing protein n=1 Tax=Neobacillus muris TaxID=2941334 RepID=UPI00203F50B9|nr:HD domain-containing protein [Neobacillus muris]